MLTTNSLWISISTDQRGCLSDWLKGSEEARKEGPGTTFISLPRPLFLPPPPFPPLPTRGHPHLPSPFSQPQGERELHFLSTIVGILGRNPHMRGMALSATDPWPQITIRPLDRYPEEGIGVSTPGGPECGLQLVTVPSPGSYCSLHDTAISRDASCWGRNSNIIQKPADSAEGRQVSQRTTLLRSGC